MLADGKENFYPNSSIVHDSTTDTGSKILTNLLGVQHSPLNIQRPLLFSEILFNNANSNHFSTSCTSPIRDISPNLTMR